jgi:hypothetical protein
MYIFRERRNEYRTLTLKHKERDRFEDLGVFGRKILNSALMGTYDSG